MASVVRITGRKGVQAQVGRNRWLNWRMSFETEWLGAERKAESRCSGEMRRYRRNTSGEGGFLTVTDAETRKLGANRIRYLVVTVNDEH